MTLTPDDLPDPGELSQVFCGCTSSEFHLVRTETEEIALCAKCNTVNGRWRRESQPPPGMFSEAAQEWVRPPPIVDYQITVGGRDTLHGPVVGAAWGAGGTTDGPPSPAQPLPPERISASEEEIREHLGTYPPPLTNYSPGMCNVYLEGGDYDGQITWLMVPTEEFIPVGVPGRYVRTERIRDQRIVYTHEE